MRTGAALRAAIDGAPEFLRFGVGKHRLPCPWCRKGPRDDAMEIRATNKTITWECYRCGATGWCWREEGRARDWRPGRTDRPNCAPDDGGQIRSPQGTADDKIARARALVARCIPARGTLAETYLRSRRLELPERGDLYDERALLFCADAWHWPSERRWPCMAAPILETATNEVVGAHLTFLSPDGSGKAPVDRPRLYLGRKSGGVVKLTPDSEVTTALAIGEGIESSLVALMAGYPTWACCDAGNVAAFPVLAGVESLTILADHDDAGMKAAQAVAQRWAEAGREARILAPPTEGADWNDRIKGAANG